MQFLLYRCECGFFLLCFRSVQENLDDIPGVTKKKCSTTESEASDSISDYFYWILLPPTKNERKRTEIPKKVDKETTMVKRE